MEKTICQFEEIIKECEIIFEKKMLDYGSAWRILRVPSLTDQIFIKANRIRTIQEKGVKKVNEGYEDEFMGIINYSIMALIQLEKNVVDRPDIDLNTAKKLFEAKSKEALQLMIDKNHDYGEAWRKMRVSSITDLILQKLLRIKQIESNDGKTTIYEGLDANYYNIINYAVFALILIKT